MKKIVFKSLLVGTIAIMFASCASNETANSDTVSQSEIYQSYSVDYNDADMELSATASFRFGGNKGTTLALISPSQVTFNGEKMAQDNNMFSGTFYKINRQAKFPGSFNFVYTDSDKHCGASAALSSAGCRKARWPARSSARWARRAT